jgi:predicted transcriptional regulator
MYVKDLMSPGVVSVGSADTLATARDRLQANRIHHLLVLKTGRLVGILSYRDLIGKDDTLTVGEVMSRDVVTVEPWETLRSAAGKMLGRSHGCLPVIDRGEVTGILTSSDLMRAVAAQARTAAATA